MKKFTLLLIFAALISCSNDHNNVYSKNNLNGKWNWIITSGGFGGGVQTPETTKQTRVIQFSDNTLRTYINGNLFQTQKFTIQTKPSVLGGNRKVIVINKESSLNNEVNIDQSFDIIGEKLYLRQECIDCYTFEYKRIK